jgi:hypothetical protein
MEGWTEWVSLFVFDSNRLDLFFEGMMLNGFSFPSCFRFMDIGLGSLLGLEYNIGILMIFGLVYLWMLMLVEIMI